ncbi:MAG: PadR family transcriptional regulator [Anaerolineaceae bacterium]|nr:PadR family transcriptional regulator [Anaerolineaceae bacterium]
MTDNKRPGDILPLTPAVFHILLALAQSPKHGYAIMQDVETVSNGQVTMGPGTLYGSIKRMVQSDLIEEVPAPPDEDDPRRRYYQLTAEGRHILRAEADRLASLVNIAANRRVLGS